MRYFKITCKQGHHGKGRYQPISFVFYAENAIEAMDLAKAMPSVKHGQTILSCQEISYADYRRERQVSAYRKVDKFG